jgi:hypothetical protein
MYQHAKKIQDSVFHNKNIVTLDQGIELHPDPPDFEAAIILKANNLSLKVSAILELVHTNNGGLPNKYIPYSPEAALLSSAMIKFHKYIKMTAYNGRSYDASPRCKILS